MSEELKPCPCGKSARFMECAFGRWSVHCSGEDFCFTLEGEYQTREQAAEAWNTRPAKPLTLEQIEGIVWNVQKKHGDSSDETAWIECDAFPNLAQAIHAALPDQQELVEALRYIVDRSQLALDDPMWVLDEQACDMTRAALAKFGG